MQGNARAGAPEHAALDDLDVVRDLAAEMAAQLEGSPGVSPMPPAGAPQPPPETRAALAAWLRSGAPSGLETCVRPFAGSRSRIVVTPTAGGSATVHLSQSGPHTMENPDILQEGTLRQGRYPVPVGSHLRLRFSLPPIGGPAGAVRVEWLDDCRSVARPAAVTVTDGVLEWTPGPDDLGDHLVRLSSPGDVGRDVVVEVRPDPPGVSCHDEFGQLAVTARPRTPAGSVDRRFSVTVLNTSDQTVALDELRTSAVSVGVAPDVLYPARAKGAMLGPGESRTFPVTFCAYPDRHNPGRKVYYRFVANGRNAATSATDCGYDLLAAEAVPVAEEALPGRELPELVDVANLLGLLNDDGLGKALMVGDFDRDGRWDLVAMDGQGPLRLYYARGGPLQFERQPSPFSVRTMGIASSWIDLRDDGVLSVFATSWPNPMWGDVPASRQGSLVLLENDGTGAFPQQRDLTPTQDVAPRNTAVLDYDLDGYLDLYVPTWGGRLNPSEREVLDGRPGDMLLRNDGTGRLVETSDEAGARASSASTSVVVIDADEDGWQDLFVAGYGAPVLLLNNADGTFRRRELDVSNWPHRFLRVPGSTAPRFNTWEVAFADYNADGHLDVAGVGIPDREDDLGVVPSWVFTGDGRGGFALHHDATVLGGGNPCLSWGMGLQVGDLNDDGYPEVYQSGGEISSGWHHQLWLNQTAAPGAAPRFVDRTSDVDYPASGSERLYPYRGHGGSMLDVDDDGDLDFIQVNGGMTVVPDSNSQEPWRVFLNEGSGHGSLELDLVGGPSNREAVGARVDVDLQGGTGPRHLTQWVHPNNGFPGGELPGRVHFGLFDATGIGAVRVRWPDGQVTTHTTGGNRRLVVREPELLRLAATFRADRGGFEGGTLRDGALCFPASGEAGRALGGPRRNGGESLATRLDFPTGVGAGEAGVLTLSDGPRGVSLTVGAGGLALRFGGAVANAPLPAPGVGRRLLVRLVVEPAPEGQVALAFVDHRELARLPMPAFAPTRAALGGSGVCFGPTSLY